jgi:hypothetical protein
MAPYQRGSGAMQMHPRRSWLVAVAQYRVAMGSCSSRGCPQIQRWCVPNPRSTSATSLAVVTRSEARVMGERTLERHPARPGAICSLWERSES